MPIARERPGTHIFTIDSHCELSGLTLVGIAADACYGTLIPLLNVNVCWPLVANKCRLGDEFIDAKHGCRIYITHSAISQIPELKTICDYNCRARCEILNKMQHWMALPTCHVLILIYFY